MTLPVIRAIAKASPAEKKFWERCLSDLDQTDKDFKEAVALLDKHNTLQDSLAEARRYAGQGIKALSVVPEHPLRQNLEDLMVFAVERDY